MKKRQIYHLSIIFLVLILLPALLTAAETMVLKEGLVIKMPRRSAMSITPVDPVEKMLVDGTWKAPIAGEKIKFTAEESGTWEKMTANEKGWFEHPSLRGGYACLSIILEKPETMILEGLAHEMVYVNGKPRAGNRYQYKEDFDAWEPRFDYSLLPVELVKGRNDLIFHSSRSGRLKVKLFKPETAQFLNIKDLTIPDLFPNESVEKWGAAIIVNASNKPLQNCIITATINQSQTETEVPSILPYSTRKVGFKMKGTASGQAGTQDVQLTLVQKKGEIRTTLDEETISLRIVEPGASYRVTFRSQVDGSIQYYAVNPAMATAGDEPKALILSVHGAGVEAINQANSYKSKTWGHIVAPTNRRPYGFNWEDWGRTDAMEVLDLAQKTLKIDPSRIYLTGHSMGGHGTWHLGATFPDKFAVLGPSAGWISFWSYRVREGIENPTPVEQMLMRPTLPSNTFEMVKNYENLGIYIIHGKDDDNVRVEQSYQMVEHLNKFHKDFIFHEEKDAGHWWDKSDESGSDCVDWAPLFDFFARHARPEKERTRQVKFLVANPGISASYYWVTVDHQIEQLKQSAVDIRFDPGVARFVGSTQNVARLSLEPTEFPKDRKFTVVLDSQKVENIVLAPEQSKIWLGKRDNKWQVIDTPSLALKGAHRYGTFKEAFKNQFIFVYGTRGTQAENEWALAKVRYDAENFWYQGNGSVDIVADVDFNPAAEKDRNVILYGNANTNLAWKALLGTSPVQVRRGEIQIGNRKTTGSNLACLLIRPRPGSDIASVGAVSGTGVVGMRVTDRRPYLSPGFAYPDCVVFSSDMLTQGSQGVVCAGFFGEDWRVETGEFEWGR